MVTISTKISEFERVRAVAERFPHVYCTVGIHPHEAEDEPETSAARLIELAQHPKVVGIGETGLDFFYEHSPREAQETAFRAHIAASRETGLPLIVHTRDADEDTARILAEEMEKGAFPGLLHCFSSSRQLAEKAVDFGFYISLSGILTFKKAEELRETAEALPLDRLLVETDAPYLAPVPKRGKRNEPSFVVHTRPPQRIFSSFSVAYRAKRYMAHEARSNGSGQRLVGRRAAYRQSLGRLRPGRAEKPAAALFAADRAIRSGRTASQDKHPHRHVARYARAASRRASRLGGWRSLHA
jgi:TatD DNase family protein